MRERKIMAFEAKRVLAMIMCLVLLLGIAPQTSFASTELPPEGITHTQPATGSGNVNETNVITGGKWPARAGDYYYDVVFMPNGKDNYDVTIENNRYKVTTSAGTFEGVPAEIKNFSVDNADSMSKPTYKGLAVVSGEVTGTPGDSMGVKINIKKGTRYGMLPAAGVYSATYFITKLKLDDGSILQLPLDANGSGGIGQRVAFYGVNVPPNTADLFEVTVNCTNDKESHDEETVTLDSQAGAYTINPVVQGDKVGSCECEISVDSTPYITAYNASHGNMEHNPAGSTEVHKVSWDIETQKWSTINFDVECTSVYNVVFDKNADDATGTMADMNEKKLDETFNLTKNGFTRPGYVFKGWSETNNGKVKYSDGASVKGLTNEGGGKNVTLYAVWEKIPTYTISFDANDGTGNMEDMTGVVIDEDTALTKNKFTRDGYTFEGWSTTADGEVEYKDGASVKNLAEADGTATLYAVWSKVPTYSVVFDKNADDANGTTAGIEDKKVGEEFELTANGFTRPGNYVFAGWSKTPKGSVDYKDKALVKDLATGDGDTVTLYAVWDKGTIPVDTDGDGNPDSDVPALGPDKDGAYTDDGGKKYIDPDGDGVYSPASSTPVDTDGDGKPDKEIPLTEPDKDGVRKDKDGNEYIDPDGDGVYSPATSTPVDTDGDGKPNKEIPLTEPDKDGVRKDKDGNEYIDPDGDGVYSPATSTPVDTDGDGKPNKEIPLTEPDKDGVRKDKDGNEYIDPDGDGVYSPATSTPVDTDGDGKPDKNVALVGPDENGLYTDADGNKYFDPDGSGVFVRWFPAITQDPPVKKVVSGKDAYNTKGRFVFTMVGAENAPMPAEISGKTTYNKANNTLTATLYGEGEIEFGNITYTVYMVPRKGNSKTFTYYLGEINTGNESYTYDTVKYTMTVTVTNTGEGLSKTVKFSTASGKAVDDITFTNVYKSPAAPTTTEPETSVPNTGDMMDVTMYIALMLVAAGTVTILRKREDVE